MLHSHFRTSVTLKCNTKISGQRNKPQNSLPFSPIKTMKRQIQTHLVQQTKFKKKNKLQNPIMSEANEEATTAPNTEAIPNMLKILEQQEPSTLTFANDERKKFEIKDLMNASMELLRDSTLATTVKAVMENDMVVVKMYKQMNIVEEQVFNDHLKLLGNFKHPNLVPIVAYMYTPKEKFFVMEYVRNGSLASHLYGERTPENPAFLWDNRLKVLKTLIKGVTYLFRQLPKKKPLFHGNLKSSNVLVDKNFNALVTDYVLDTLMDPDDVHEYLAAYKAPEWAQINRIAKQSDVWCLGVIMMEILWTRPRVQKYMDHHAKPYGPDLQQFVSEIAGEVYAGNMKIYDAEINGEDEHAIWQMCSIVDIGLMSIQEDLEERIDWIGDVIEIEKL